MLWGLNNFSRWVINWVKWKRRISFYQVNYKDLKISTLLYNKKSTNTNHNQTLRKNYQTLKKNYQTIKKNYSFNINSKYIN